ncbi:3-dehydroquinate synthase [Xanthocytophaga agilis]|uniref:3-dehydroquinate synthase n=1 Tax=Xanthocytophaga agilis TaxID=3048010 RepID=A0AAE3R714_9BACT|nr:3-dehydroquinate synthase [Xanthocytophaga agilis]MDJ1502629.1 3-dehydroquinate synthase [Xanthocytophaga agilis]
MGHQIQIEKSITTSLTSFLEVNKYSQLIVLVDENTKRYCYPLVKATLPKHTLIQIKSGEEQKHLETCMMIWQKMTDVQLDRKALLINLGGGVIGDMGGFCAATYKRGIDFIQMPTTLLSQVDASVGGKLGIDFQGLKNHIGVFQNPKAVLIATDFLQTLLYAEVRSGFAEVIKHCLIADSQMWDEIRRKDLEEQSWNELVRHSVKVKETIVEQDPTEKGLRKILNFGHTIGHAVESYFLEKPKRKLLHGEAIAIGMIAEAYLSYKRKLLSEESLMQIEEFIFSIYGKVDIQETDMETIAPLALQDKKNAGGKIQCVLLKAIGEPIIDQAISLKDIKDGLKYYQK